MKKNDEDMNKQDQQYMPDGASINDPDIDEGLSKVAVSKSQNILFFGALVLVIGLVIYFSFFDDDDTQKKVKPSEITNMSSSIKPPESTPIEVKIPQLPSVPQLVVPQPVAPKVNNQPPAITSVSVAIPQPHPVQPTIPGGLPIIKKDEKAEARKKSSISLLAGQIDPNIVEAGGLQSAPLGKSPNQKAATFMGDLNFIVAQGKVIDAVLESAISTDLAGPIRAIISRDVYAESGNNVLLPKGSRLIGKYNNNVKVGQNRIDVTWDRAIRPDGIDINIASLAVDNLGRSGVTGQVETGYLQAFASAVMVSAVNYALAREADKAQTQYNSNPANQQNNVSIQGYYIPNGTNTPPYNPLYVGYTGPVVYKTGNVLPDISGNYVPSVNPLLANNNPNNQQNVSAAKTSIQQAQKDIGDLAKNIISDNLKIGPKIFVDQGTSLKVFVQQDLVFPSNIHSNLQVIQ